MTLPTLPSDNLYKFKAFLGLTLIALALYIPLIKMDRIYEKMREANVEGAKIDVQAKNRKEHWKEREDEYQYYLSKYQKDTTKRQLVTKSSFDSLNKICNDDINKMADAIKPTTLDENFEMQLAVAKAHVQNIRDIFYEEILSNLCAFIIMIFWGIYLSKAGFKDWYEKTQYINDQILENDLLSKPVIYRYCQSCHRDLTEYKNNRGTESDLTENKLFCSICYKNGEFVEPNLTLEEMKKKTLTELEVLNFPKKISTKFVETFHNLQRWKGGY